MLCRLEGRGIFKKNLITLSHLPTLLLVIGYAVFWLELYVFRATKGVTSALAPVLFSLLAVYAFIQNRSGFFQSLRNFRQQFTRQRLFVKINISLGLFLTVFIFACVFRAAMLPPHLPQEDDALRYHLSLPRQHLIINSFTRYLPWEWEDIEVMPIDYALAPYCFATSLPNKIPHFIFLLGLLAVAVNLARRFSDHKWIAGLLVVFAIVGSHGIGIQMGTAMLDLIICYLFLAAVDSFLSGRWGIGIIEFAFFFWSKAFIPMQIILIAAVIGGIYLILEKRFFQTVQWGFAGNNGLEPALRYQGKGKQILAVFLAVSLVTAGPFIAKSFYYAGTPLYPFAPGLFKVARMHTDPSEWKGTMDQSRELMGIRDWYGYKRTLPNFVKHLFVIAVPDNEVNNRFDYPMGLPYLLFLGPFLYFCLQGLQKKIFMIGPLFTIVFWISWWMGSQQTRFLYIPVILMFLTVIPFIQKPSRILWCLLILALALNALSLCRSHKNDFFRSRYEVLMERDKNLVAMSQAYLREGRSDRIELDYPQMTFAQFPAVRRPR